MEGCGDACEVKDGVARPEGQRSERPVQSIADLVVEPWPEPEHEGRHA